MKKVDKSLFENLIVLYVEDDDMTVEEISFFLKKYVKKLLIAKNGQEGIDLFKAHKPNIVISDIQMPIKNGLDMCEEILKIEKDFPIVLTSAYSDGDYLIKAIELGIEKYLLKPINMIEMLAVIQKSLNLGKQNKLCDDFDDYVQFLLDSNPSFMFILHGEEIEYVNKNFLKQLGHENINSLKEASKLCKDIFILENLEEDENWIDHIVKNSDKSHLVSVKKTGHNLKSEFFVTHKYFKSTNKSVLVFIDTQEQKLKKIENITNQILNKNLEKKDYINGLEKINKICAL
ncbi:response regulator transcription factor [Arcobacter arenosus]|uniref:response regulator transcription factor n=1 Tax=Arcobacter arenosus TaxID=2576037 RepID=UPI003BAAF98D